MIRFLAAAVLLFASPVRAEEIKVLTAGAFRSVIAALAPEFEARTGHHIELLNDTAGGVAQRIGRGERFDLAVLTPATVGPLVRLGQIAGPAIPVAKVEIGVGVRQGAALPDIASPAAFRAALLAARAVAVIDPASGGSSGIYMVELFRTMGIAAEMTPKLVLVPGGLAADRLLTGEADLAIQQTSEIVAVPGAVLVGGIPEALQSRTTYVAVLPIAASGPARDLLAELSSDRAHALLTERGMAPP